MDLTNNNVTIAGKIVSSFTYENKVCGDGEEIESEQEYIGSFP